jgi:hypothetical protein
MCMVRLLVSFGCDSYCLSSHGRAKWSYVYMARKWLKRYEDLGHVSTRTLFSVLHSAYLLRKARSSCIVCSVARDCLATPRGVLRRIFSGPRIAHRAPGDDLCRGVSGLKTRLSCVRGPSDGLSRLKPFRPLLVNPRSCLVGLIYLEPWSAVRWW